MDGAERTAALRAVTEKFTGSGPALAAARALFREAASHGTDDEVRTTAARLLESARLFGPPVEQSAWMNVLQALGHSRKVSPVSLEFARKAEKALTPDDSPAYTIGILKALLQALLRVDKQDEARQVTARIARIEEQLDTEFARTAIPFATPPFAGRRPRATALPWSSCSPAASVDRAWRPTSLSMLPSKPIGPPTWCCSSITCTSPGPTR